MTDEFMKGQRDEALSERDNAIARVDRLTRDASHLVASWVEGAEAIEELSKIENGGEPSETVQGAAAQLRRCASQLSSVLATPLELAEQIGGAGMPPDAQLAAAADLPAPPSSPKPSGT